MQLCKTAIMLRDGIRESLWQAFMPQYQPVHSSIPDTTFDVVIAGGGITGISTALELQKAGKKCLLAEAYSIGFGTTGGTTAHLNTLLETPYYQVEKDFGEKSAQLLAAIADKAIQLVKTNVETYNIDCYFKQLPAYLFSEDEKQSKELESILYSNLKVDLSAAETNKIPVPIPFQKAAVFHQQAQIHPTKYIYALAKAFEDAGGVLLHNCRVLNASGTNEKLLETSLGNISTKYIVYATHIPLHINLLHFRCAPYRSYAMSVKLKNTQQYPEALVYDMQDPYHYYRTQIVNDETYLIAGGEDHKTGHEPNTENCFRNLEAHVRKYFDVEEVVYRWSSQYYEPADGLAYIGHLPGADNAFVATGFSGNGITLGTASAIIITELILKGDSVYKELFDPRRIKPVAGFMNFVKENADVVKEFVSKRFHKEAIETVTDIAKGEAKVVDFENEAIALYRDESGSLHAVSPVCKHAKCIVAWNTAEQSWDCPCHGARYNADGIVITAPAHSNLNKIDLDDER